jgi:hypothetical protein
MRHHLIVNFKLVPQLKDNTLILTYKFLKLFKVATKILKNFSDIKYLLKNSKQTKISI